jgi:Toprim domain-containing protein
VIPATLVKQAGAVDFGWVLERSGVKTRRATAHERVGPSPIAGGDDGFSINAHKGVWRDRRCGVGGNDAISLYAHIHGLDLKDGDNFREAVEALTGENIKQAPPARARVEDAAARAAAIRDALGVFEASVNPYETPVESYLHSCGLDLSDDTAGSVIRWHERGAMVCLMRNVLTGEPQAVHQTLLDRQGRKRFVTLKGADKPTCRLFKGPVGGAAVMLDPPGSGLHIGEGVETCLAARQIGLRPVWALGSAGEIAKLPALSGVEALTLLRERCPRNASASETCGRRWHAAGREVFNVWPSAGKDLNDTIQGRAA